MPGVAILLKIAAILEGVPLSRLNLRIFAGVGASLEPGHPPCR